ncbi:MAG: hypothetical protein JSV08_08350 [Acidobacteriota bacterium]|nr:MAG: hypothetical protein JSV08_08350 [Acidobacteriota bacterium]
MKGAATWICFTLAAASAVWGGEAPTSPGKGPPRVGGEVEIANVPFDINEVIRKVRKNRGLPEEPPKQGFHAEARGERPFAQKGNVFSHETPRFQAEIGESGLRYFAQGSRGRPDFEILSVSFEWGGNTQTVFGKGRLEEHAPGLLQGEARGSVTPYARNRGEEGIELYWTIGGPLSPEASALRVRLAIRAAGEPQEHDEGLVFPTWNGSGQVAFSNVTVADSAGRRERVRPSLATRHKVLFKVPREFLENAQYPILIDPTVGPEILVDPSPVIGPASGNQEVPSVASNGTDYFVAWEDRRNGTDDDIYGARVTSDGTVLDPMGIRITTTTNGQWDPSVASNGTDYFVAWWVSGNIYGARVASDGTVLDPFPFDIAVSTAAGTQRNPSTASNGTDYFVVWEDERNGADFDIYGARVRASDGLLLDGPSDTGGIAVSTAAIWQEYPSVASNGTDYFVAWQDYRNWATTDYDIYGARVRASDGLLLDGPPDTGGIAVSTAADDQEDPSVASNGTDYFVAWQDSRNYGASKYDIYGTRVTSDGTVLDSTGIAVSTATNHESTPSVASNGTNYFVAWEDSRSGSWDIYGARVASNGTVLDPAGIAVSTAASNQYNPSVASNGTDYFIAWNQYLVGYDVYGARVASNGTVLDPTGITVSTTASGQIAPSAASNGTDYFVAWQENRNGTDFDIYGARVASDGTVLDSSGIALSTAADDQERPSVASNGTDYFVAWADYRSGTNLDIYGARVTSAGAVLDPAGIAVSTAADMQYWPSVASNGTDYFVAWYDKRNGTDTDIYGARVRAFDGYLHDGPPDTGGIAVSTAADDQSVPSAASNGTDYFVAWDDWRNDGGCFCDWDIYGARVTSAGTVLDPAGIAVSTVADGYMPPSVASNGTDYFVAWVDERNWATTGWDIYGARVTSVGTVLDPAGIAVSTASGSQTYYSAASNGTDYFVAWDDNGNNIYGTRVASDGTVLDAAGLLIQQSLSKDQPLAVAYSSCGKYLVAYIRFHDDPDFQSQRVMARLFYDGLKACVAEVSAPAGIVPLLVEDAGGGQVEIWWENHGELLQYNIYEGDLDAPFYNHLSLVCWTAGTDEGEGYLSGIITPGFANAYYLVTECDTATEGTSGYDSAAVERNPALNTCGPHP